MISHPALFAFYFQDILKTKLIVKNSSLLNKLFFPLSYLWPTPGVIFKRFCEVDLLCEYRLPFQYQLHKILLCFHPREAQEGTSETEKTNRLPEYCPAKQGPAANLNLSHNTLHGPEYCKE